jgi:cell division protein ZapB
MAFRQLGRGHVATRRAEGEIEIGQFDWRHEWFSESAWAATLVSGQTGMNATPRVLRGLAIDRLTRPNYSVPMDTLEQTGRDLERLEQQLQALLAQIRKLKEENHSLQARQDSLVAERAALVAKNDEARTKVEAMIHRLKALEQV